MRAFFLATPSPLRIRRFPRVMALLVVHAPGIVYHWRGHGPTPPEPLPSRCSDTEWLKYPCESASKLICT